MSFHIFLLGIWYLAAPPVVCNTDFTACTHGLKWGKHIPEKIEGDHHLPIDMGKAIISTG